MSSPSQPARRKKIHQRNTLRQIFQHPAGHNIEWRAVLSLLAAVGSAEERHDGKVAVTIGSQTEYFDPPRHKEHRHPGGCQPAPDADPGRRRSRRYLPIPEPAAGRPDSHSAVRLCITGLSLPEPGARRGTGTACDGPESARYTSSSKARRPALCATRIEVHAR